MQGNNKIKEAAVEDTIRQLSKWIKHGWEKWKERKSRTWREPKLEMIPSRVKRQKCTGQVEESTTAQQKQFSYISFVKVKRIDLEKIEESINSFTC